MSTDARIRVVCMLAFSWLVAAVSARPAESQLAQSAPNTAPDTKAQLELGRLFAGLLSDTSPHMRMGPTRVATPSDSARAAGIVVAARSALSQYTDVKLAERDGYYRNGTALDDLPIYHYNNLQNFGAANRGEFDVTKPVSLLYKKGDGGQLRLIGVMYATGASMAPEQLDALLPISMAHWHEHVNLCYPAGSAARALPKAIDNRTVFWIRLFFSITSEDECRHAGGQFVPVEFGWMAHVYLFADRDDPKAIWDTDDAGNMDTHMRHATPDND
jgi:hypothetical protein